MTWDEEELANLDMMLAELFGEEYASSVEIITWQIALAMEGLTWEA